MRATCLTLTFLGCVGGARLGQEPALAARDAAVVDNSDDSVVGTSDESPEDASLSLPTSADGGLSANISLVQPPDSCGGCFVLGATGPDPQVRYTFTWDDGSTAARRKVCPAVDSPPYRVTLLDPSKLNIGSASFSASALPDLCAADAGTPVAALCVSNGSFDQAQSASGPVFPTSLGASPWQTCGMAPNFPQLIDTDMATLFMLPQATEGRTYLSLRNGNQVSEPLCAPIAAGTSFSFRVDLAHDSGAAQNGTSNPVLELWGGPDAVCAPAELLWFSPTPLSSTWQSFCATVTPRLSTATLTLRATVSASLPVPNQVLVDHLQPVATCSP